MSEEKKEEQQQMGQHQTEQQAEQGTPQETEERTESGAEERTESGGEERTESGGEERTESGAEERTESGANFGDQVRGFTNQFEHSVRNLLSSENAQHLQQELSSGFEEIQKQVHQALSAMEKSSEFQNLSNRGQQALDDMQENKALRDFQQTLASGVSQISEQFSAFIGRMREQQSPKSGEETDDTGAGQPDATTSREQDTTTDTGTPSKADTAPEADTEKSEDGTPGQEPGNVAAEKEEASTPEKTTDKEPKAGD